MRGRLGFSSCISKMSYRLSDSATTQEQNLEEGIELVHPPCPGLCDVTARSKENICFSVAQNDSSLHCSVMFRLHFVLVYVFFLLHHQFAQAHSVVSCHNSKHKCIVTRASNAVSVNILFP